MYKCHVRLDSIRNEEKERTLEEKAGWKEEELKEITTTENLIYFIYIRISIRQN